MPVLGAIAAHKKKGKFLFEHGIYPREREEVLGSTWIEGDFKGIWIDYFYYLSKLAYQYCDKIISLFEYNRRIQIEYGAPPEKTFVIPNGVDEKKYGSIVREKGRVSRRFDFTGSSYKRCENDDKRI